MQTVGGVLRAEREKQGISIKDVEKGTSIRALYIQAIEDDKYSVLPGEVYLKGFVRNYAAFLGLDPQALMEVYRRSQEPQPAAAPTAPAERPRERESKPAGETRSGGSGGRWLIALVIIALVAGGAWAAMTFLNQPPDQPKPAPQAQQPVKPPPPPAAPAPVAPAKPPAATPAAAPIVVTAKYTDSCWTQVTADGQNIFTGIPKVGDTLTWNAKQNMIIRLGNAGGVDMTYNGQPQGPLGGDGDVIVKTFGLPTSGTASPTNITNPR